VICSYEVWAELRKDMGGANFPVVRALGTYQLMQPPG
jgi:hypothetical protein